jgi:hypothetical protein
MLTFSSIQQQKQAFLTYTEACFFQLLCIFHSQYSTYVYGLIAFQFSSYIPKFLPRGVPGDFGMSAGLATNNVCPAVVSSDFHQFHAFKSVTDIP